MAREPKDTRPLLRALKPMTLGELRTALSRITEDAAVDLDSIVICEGWNEEGDFVQGCVESVTTEARCEDDDESDARNALVIECAAGAGAPLLPHGPERGAVGRAVTTSRVAARRARCAGTIPGRPPGWTS